MFNIVSGILGAEVEPRIYDVVQVPDNVLLRKVRLPFILANQTKPLQGSIVIVAREGYKSFILAILREPQDFVNENSYVRGFGEGYLDPGEIFFESTGLDGTPPGSGATFFMSNNGTVEIASGKGKETLYIGGTESDDDAEVILQGDNGYLIGNTNHITNMRSSFDFDSFNNIHIGNSIVTVPTDPSLPLSEVVMNELTMDTFGNIELRNTTAGVTKSILSLDAVGDIDLKNIAGGLHLNSIGIMTLNSGTLGAARLTDLVTSTSATDIQYWQMISAIQTFFMSLSAFAGGSPVVHSELGALGLAYLAQVPIAPPSLTSKVTSASSTVKIG